jgi:hypothetical protein
MEAEDHPRLEAATKQRDVGRLYARVMVKCDV